MTAASGLPSPEGLVFPADATALIEGPARLPAVSACDYCAAPHEREGRFCSDRHRSAWHRDREPRAKVRSSRRLARGGTSITIHFPAEETPRALSYAIGEQVFLGRATGGTNGQ